MSYASKIKNINKEISDLKRQKVAKALRWQTPEMEPSYLHYRMLRGQIDKVCEPFVDDRFRIDSAREQYYVYSDFELSDLYAGLERIKKKLVQSPDNVSEAAYYDTLLEEFAEEKIESELLALEKFIQETQCELNKSERVNTARAAYLQARSAGTDVSDLTLLQLNYERNMHELILGLQKSGNDRLLLAQQAVQNRISEYSSQIKQKAYSQNNVILEQIQQSFDLLITRIKSMNKPSRFIITKITNKLTAIESHLMLKITALASAKNSEHSYDRDLNLLNDLIKGLKNYAHDIDKHQFKSGQKSSFRETPVEAEKPENNLVFYFGKKNPDKAYSDDNEKSKKQIEQMLDENLKEYTANVNNFVDMIALFDESEHEQGVITKATINAKNAELAKVFKKDFAVQDSQRKMNAILLNQKNNPSITEKQRILVKKKYDKLQLQYLAAARKLQNMQRNLQSDLNKINQQKQRQITAQPTRNLDLTAIGAVIRRYEEYIVELQEENFQNKLTKLGGNIDEAKQLFSLFPFSANVERSRKPIGKRLTAKKAHLEEVTRNIQSIISEEGVLNTIDQVLSELTSEQAIPRNNDSAENIQEKATELRSRITLIKEVLSEIDEQTQVVVEHAETLLEKLGTNHESVSYDIKVKHSFENDQHCSEFIFGESFQNSEIVKAGVRAEADLEYTKTKTIDGTGNVIEFVSNEILEEDIALQLVINAMLDAINSNVIDVDNHFYIAGSDEKFIKMSILIAKAHLIPLSLLDVEFLEYNQEREEIATPYELAESIYNQASESGTEDRRLYQQIQKMLEEHKEIYTVKSAKTDLIETMGKRSGKHTLAVIR